MKETNGQNQSQRTKKKIAHAELWAWAEETLARQRVHSVGITGFHEISRESLGQSLSDFSKALKTQEWCVVECLDTMSTIGVEHQLSSRLFEYETSSHVPKHVELTAHHKSKLPLDGLVADATMSSLRRDGTRESIPPHLDEVSWHNLDLKLPDEWSSIDTPLQGGSHENDQSVNTSPLDPSISEVPEYNIGGDEVAKEESFLLSSLDVILKACRRICKNTPILITINRQSLTEKETLFLEAFVDQLHRERSQYSLLLLWAYPKRKLDDSVRIKGDDHQRPFDEKVGSTKGTSAEESMVQKANSVLEDSNYLEEESVISRLTVSFDHSFKETFSHNKDQTSFMVPIDQLIDHSVNLDHFEGDPLELMNLSLKPSLPDFEPKIATEGTANKTTKEQPQVAYHTIEEQPQVAQHTTPSPITDQTTTELPKISSKPPQEVILIERGGFVECQQIASKQFGTLAPALLVFAASGPTATIGQMSTLWRSVIEHPLKDVGRITESMWECLSSALESNIVISTSHQRFINEQSFRFRDPTIALHWRERWMKLVSSRLRRRAHGTLAQWMQDQSVNPIAQPQVTLTVLEHWIEAGATTEAGRSGLEAAKLLIERGDGVRAKRALQRVVQLLGPEGSWSIWRESLELLLKLNLEVGDNIAIEFVSKQLIDRAWRIGEISLIRRLSLILENLYKTTGRNEEALHLGEWSMSQPLVDQTAALFDQPLTMFPSPGMNLNQSFDERTVKYPTLLADLPPPQDLYTTPIDDELMPIPEIHTLEAPPAFLLHALSTLRQNNYESFIVGGSVRDRLLGRDVNDWDLTTSAHPHEVSACFDKVIETGIEHGTVTVILNEEHIEITTYRIDGEYADGRRPDDVLFTRSLTEDLLRRDFTINAIAWDPINASLEDPYEGVADLQRSILRAVGDPMARFREDGLRVLRAIRFATVLDFTIEEMTQKGAIDAVDVLRKVAVERVQVELFKTLLSPHAQRGLFLIKTFGVLDVCFPKMPSIRDDSWSHLERAMAHCEPNIETRLALIFHAVFQDQGCSKLVLSKIVKTTLKALKVSNKLSLHVLHLMSFSSLDPSRERTDAQARALGVDIGVDYLDSLLSYQKAWLGESEDTTSVQVTEEWSALKDRLHHLNISALPHTPKDLDVNGRELCDALDLFPSKAIGELLSTLLRWVWESPERNHKEMLVNKAKEIASERGMIS